MPSPAPSLRLSSRLRNRPMERHLQLLRHRAICPTRPLQRHPVSYRRQRSLRPPPPGPNGGGPSKSARSLIAVTPTLDPAECLRIILNERFFALVATWAVRSGWPKRRLAAESGAAHRSLGTDQARPSPSVDGATSGSRNILKELATPSRVAKSGTSSANGSERALASSLVASI